MKKLKEFIIDIGIRFLMLCCLPIIWFLQFSRWLKDKIIGDL